MHSLGKLGVPDRRRSELSGSCSCLLLFPSGDGCLLIVDGK